MREKELETLYNISTASSIQTKRVTGKHTTYLLSLNLHHCLLLTTIIHIVNNNTQNKANNGWKKGFLGPSSTSSSHTATTSSLLLSSTSSSIRPSGHPLPTLPPIAEEPNDTAAMDASTSTTISAKAQSLSNKLDQLNLSDHPPPTITPPPPTAASAQSIRDKIIKDKIIEKINESGLSTAPPPMRTFAPNASQAKRARMIVADKVTERFLDLKQT